GAWADRAVRACKVQPARDRRNDEGRRDRCAGRPAGSAGAHDGPITLYREFTFVEQPSPGVTPIAIKPAWGCHPGLPESIGNRSVVSGTWWPQLDASLARSGRSASRLDRR